MRLSDVKLCIFDMDGLIFDTESLYLEQFPKILKEYGYNLSNKQLLKTIGMNTKACKKYYLELFPNLNFELVLNKIDNYIINASENGTLKFMKGALEIIEYFKKNNIKIAIASSSDKLKIEKFLKDKNIYQYFDLITSGEEVKESKPNPEIFITTMKKLNILNENTIILEDSYNGIRAANSSGAKAIMIPDLLKANDEMRKLSYKIYNNLEEVILDFERNK